MNPEDVAQAELAIRNADHVVMLIIFTALSVIVTVVVVSTFYAMNRRSWKNHAHIIEIIAAIRSQQDVMYAIVQEEMLYHRRMLRESQRLVQEAVQATTEAAVLDDGDDGIFDTGSHHS